MSPLSRFMRQVTTFLDKSDQERADRSPHRPPIFVRAHWLLVEIDEGLAKAVSLAEKLKIARLDGDVCRAQEINQEIGIVARQVAQMTSWLEGQFQKERSDYVD